MVFAELFLLLGDWREEFSIDETVKIKFRNGPHQKPSSRNVWSTSSTKIFITLTYTL